MYQIKIETTDGSLEDFMDPFTNKAKATRAARMLARTTYMQDVTKVWVDRDDMGIASFPVTSPNAAHS
jgi:hypothetical protein